MLEFTDSMSTNDENFRLQFNVPRERPVTGISLVSQCQVTSSSGLVVDDFYLNFFPNLFGSLNVDSQSWHREGSLGLCLLLEGTYHHFMTSCHCGNCV